MSHSVVCPICVEIFKSTDDVYSTSCGHIYHFDCMQQWKRNSTSCPQCRHYNPTSQKLFLSFEPDTEADKNLKELKKSLETAEKNVSDAQLILDEKEREILNLKMQYETKVTELSLLESQIEEHEEKMVKLHSQLDESIFNGSRIEQELEIMKREYINFHDDSSNDDGENTMNLKLQINYFKRQIKEKDDQLNSLQVTKIKLEERLKQANKENVNLQWQSKCKVMEQRIKLLNDQLMEEVKKNAELSLKKMKGVLNENASATNVENITEQAQQGNVASVDTTIGALARTDSVERVQSTVVIRGLNNSVSRANYKTVVMRLIQMMQLPITENDIASIKLMENKHNKPGSKISLCVEFTTVAHKILFLKCKAKLRTFPDTMNLIVYEYNTDKTLTMYHFATVLRSYGYKVYCRQNDVYVAKGTMAPIKIYKTQQVHDIIKQQTGVVNPRLQLLGGISPTGSVQSLYEFSLYE